MNYSYEQRLAGAKSVYEAGLEKVRNTPEPEGQKFHIGERVWIGNMPSYMSHFRNNIWATVQYTYAHAYGGSDTKSYSLNIDGFGSSAWYEENQLSKTLTPAGEKESDEHIS